MTVGELRKLMKGADDSLEVFIWSGNGYEHIESCVVENIGRDANGARAHEDWDVTGAHPVLTISAER